MHPEALSRNRWLTVAAHPHGGPPDRKKAQALAFDGLGELCMSFRPVVGNVFIFSLNKRDVKMGLVS